MSPLRQKMIEAMRVRGYSPRTHQSYLGAVSALSKFYGRSPERLDVQALKDFFAYLAVERQLSGSSCRVIYNGIRFLYLQVLDWKQFDVAVAMPKLVRRIPELLTRAEVAALLGALANRKHRMLLTLAYGCGLRVSEVVSIKVRQIDGERHLLRVEQGKGGKDRLVMISDGLLARLRRYWLSHRPVRWLFPSREPEDCVSVDTAQKAYRNARGRVGLEKVGGFHSLRHAYATHQLEDGMPVHILQRQLGHSDLRTTMRYLHWVPDYRQGATGNSDLIARLEQRR
ncbi:MAG: site-specific integrase [Xanthomonadales bacterium]|nr:site-specific integrase [Xanthomonadales bacterium]